MCSTKKTHCIHQREILMLIDIREHVLNFSSALRLVKKLPSFGIDEVKKRKVLKLSSKLHTRIHVIDNQIYSLDSLCKEKCQEVKPVVNYNVKSTTTL